MQVLVYRTYVRLAHVLVQTDQAAQRLLCPHVLRLLTLDALSHVLVLLVRFAQCLLLVLLDPLHVHVLPQRQS